MPVANLHRYCFDHESVTHDPANRQVLDSISRFAELLPRIGYRAEICSRASLLKLPELTSQKKNSIAADFDRWSNWIEETDPSSSEHMELDFLERALDHHGFKASRQFWKTLEKGQIVEFYGGDMLQLYRSFNFFDITGYSLLDICVFEWFLLWDRPQRILESVATELNEALDTYTPVRPFTTPKHVIREIHNTGHSAPFQVRAIMARFLNLGSLNSDVLTRRPKKGFICSSIAEVIALGKEAENIQFV